LREGRAERACALEDNVEIMLSSNDSFVLDDTRMRKPLQQPDLVTELVDLLRSLPFKLDALDGDD
jgi:hypothetical protein